MTCTNGCTSVSDISKAGRVTINMAEAEWQWRDREGAEAREAQRRKDADPFGLGHWKGERDG